MPSQPAQDAIDRITAAVTSTITDLDSQLTSATANLDVAAKLHSQDQSTIAAMKAADAQQAASVAPSLLALLPSGVPVTVVTGLHQLPYDTDPNARNLLRWFQPGPTGNSNPKLTDPHGTWSIKDAGGMRTITIAPAGPYNNYFFAVNVIKGDTSATRYVQLVTFEVPDEAVPNCQAIETNWEHSLGGVRYNQGTQLFFNEGTVRYYDITARGWVVLKGVPLPPIGTGKYVTVINEVQRVAGGMTFVALTINNKRYPVNVTTKPLPTPWASYLQGAPVQMDVTGSGKGYSIMIHDAQAAWL